MSAQVQLLADCEYPAAAEEWIEAVLQQVAGREGDFSCSVLLTTEEEIRRLNREFRGRDAVTDVLSFPSRGPEEPQEADGFAGDIAVCVARAAEQAEELSQPLAEELAFLCLHGALHLHGWDHEQDDEAEEMYALQRAIMADVKHRMSPDGC